MITRESKKNFSQELWTMICGQIIKKSSMNWSDHSPVGAQAKEAVQK